MKLTKDKVIKDIPKNLVSTYLAMGWVEFVEQKSKPKFVVKEKKEETKE